MREQIYNMVLATLLLLAGSPMKLHAQTSTLTFSAVEDVADKNTDKSIYSDVGCIYLYNVGTGEYVNFGGLWGTQPMTHEVGMPLYIVSGTEAASGDTLSVATTDEKYGTYYKIGSFTTTTQGSYEGFFGYIRGSNDDTTSDDWYQLFVDRTGFGTYDGIVRMIFTPVSTDESGLTYNISFKHHNTTKHNNDGSWAGTISGNPDIYYLSAAEGDNQVVHAYKEGDALKIGEGTFTLSDNTLAQWKIVTRGNFIKNFESTNAANQTEMANATFLVVDQNFNRNNSYQNTAWQKTDGTSLTIGCGGTRSKQITYGAYWLAYITDAGEVYQEITCPVAGWYQLKLKGFCTGDELAVAFIRTLDSSGNVKSSSTSEFHQLASFTGIDVQDSLMKYDKELIAANSSYQTETTVMIYIEEDATFQIGVTSYSGSGYTLFDDVQLYYAGESYPPFVLDEDWTDTDLINVQVDASSNTRPLFLRRTLVEGQWNSLVLPVSLTASQVKGAFGGETKVCKLEKTGNSGYDIYFKSIAYTTDSYLTNHSEVEDGVLTNSDKLIKADSMYIVWPSDIDPINVEYEYTLAEINTDITLADDDLKGTLSFYFQIPLVALDKTVAEDGIVKDKDVVESNIDNGIRMEGTYIKGTEIPRYSYAISSSNGKWYYLTSSSSTDNTETTSTGSGVTSKGYRAWIRTEQGTGSSSGGAHPAVANLFIDDVQVSDGIEGVVQDMLRQETVGSVYALSGQMVNADGSLEGLPKGIYVKGGKKYVVK